MSKKKKIPDKLQIWIDARKKYRLSHAQAQMARELGLNPRKFGGIGNHKQEPWKEPLPQFIEHLYFKRFGKTAPDRVLSIEEHLSEEQRKKQERSARKQAEALAASEQSSGKRLLDAQQLVKEIEKRLPLPVYATPEFILGSQGRGEEVGLDEEMQVFAVVDSGDEIGGILCAIKNKDKQGYFMVSITHLRIRPDHPLKEEIEAYQKARVRKLRRQES